MLDNIAGEKVLWYLYFSDNVELLFWVHGIIVSLSQQSIIKPL